MKEYIDGIHLSPLDKTLNTPSYIQYLRRINGSKAVEISLLTGISVTWFFDKRIRVYFTNKTRKNIFNIHLFLFVFIFSYERILAKYSDKAFVATIDSHDMNNS